MFQTRSRFLWSKHQSTQTTVDSTLRLHIKLIQTVHHVHQHDGQHPNTHPSWLHACLSFRLRLAGRHLQDSPAHFFTYHAVRRSWETNHTWWPPVGHISSVMRTFKKLLRLVFFIMLVSHSKSAPCESFPPCRGWKAQSSWSLICLALYSNACGGMDAIFPELFTTSLMWGSSSAYRAMCRKHSRAARRRRRRQHHLHCSLCAHLTSDSTVSHPTSTSSLMTHDCYHGLYK